jgi:hypothetical protein
LNRSDVPPVTSQAPFGFLFADLAEQPLSLRALPQRRLGQWRVKVPTGGLPGDPDVEGLEVPLSYVLLLLNRAPLADRYPVAVSTRDDAETLRNQLTSRGVNDTFPIAVSQEGGSWVCWLDWKQFDGARQIMAADANLVRPRDNPEQSDDGTGFKQLDLHSGERMGGFYVFEGTTANLAEDNPTPYKRLFPEWIGRTDVARLEGLWQVAASTDDFSRGGQAIVRATREDSMGMRHNQLVVIQAALPLENGQKIAALACLKFIEEVPDAVPRQYRYLQVDQSIRDALGIEIGELARIVPCKAPRQLPRFDWLIGSPTYVMCRVQTADSTTFEHEVSLIGNLTLELLGVESGDTIVIEGLPGLGKGDNPSVPLQRVKAFQTSEEVLDRRAKLCGGDLACRFPNTRDSLGVFPDLPWIFLDSSERSALGLSDQKLGVVRIRAGRWYQLQKEFREVLLVVGIGFIGILSLFRGTTRYVLVGVLVGLITGVVVLRLGSRLSRKLKPAVNPSRLGQR